jgi:hypothetical protein
MVAVEAKKRPRKRGILVRVTVSPQASTLLKYLADQGLWGQTDRQVAARLIEDALVKLFAPPLKMASGTAEPGGRQALGTGSPQDPLSE